MYNFMSALQLRLQEDKRHRTEFVSKCATCWGLLSWYMDALRHCTTRYLCHVNGNNSSLYSIFFVVVLYRMWYNSTLDSKVGGCVPWEGREVWVKQLRYDDCWLFQGYHRKQNIWHGVTVYPSRHEWSPAQYASTIKIQIIPLTKSLLISSSRVKLWLNHHFLLGDRHDFWLRSTSNKASLQGVAI